ncbi:MAG: hypothetical protein CO158_10260 [Piscirickettsiaceae bacterium CG_4_9_14_3_um_filter_43_564]|nr:accessory factor UbiK family protein [Thiomicrospira sp.]OIP95109.1 MAG: hypothetical protein AUK56_06600 [Thiomicrospira sp. CG2_30_44_34]PIQ03365.1 MAG: hypothetical protein COW74_07480 [Piscirickettsiaceae bacterium CG18_big_fil_WC_8_21_14_2_50_44_103]PIU39161.1 MAG: hypothetical protein COT01_02925 [Piscirickettsiaceae bacterium CG07_land_8_20_14_0_80_44_28]PIW56956.1 MAG: hypothetical protein COW14_08545 [Piscirickettsiaceae bacterium CG12_big_fil_rev_8_21_14_0_65_44_934]PIW76988.1 MAG
MVNAQQLESFVEAITQVFPPGLGKIPKNIQANLKQTLSVQFEKMDLVSRQEFDIQKAVLAKTRAKLEALEKQVSELEKQLADKG